MNIDYILLLFQGDIPKEAIQPRYRMKGKSKTGNKERRKQIIFEAEKRVSHKYHS